MITKRNYVRKISFRVFRWLCRFVWGKGLAKLPLARRAYSFLYSITMPPNQIVLGEFEGQKMYFDTNDKHGMTAQLFLGGLYEKYETNLFKRVVSEGMTVVDLGANIGYYTLLLAKLVGRGGKVFAFEPDPDNFSLLLKNVEANGYDNVIPVRKAVSNKTGATKLFLCRENKGDHRIYDSHDGRESITVDVTTLDTFFENEQYPIDLIKCDIQGAEMAALQGMTEIVLKNGSLKILIEFWPKVLQSFGFSPLEFLNKLTKYGFTLYTITSREPWIKPVGVNEVVKMCKGEEFLNLFCQKST